MRKSLLCTTLFLSLFSYAQIDSLDIEYKKYISEYREYKIHDAEIEKGIKCAKDFPIEYGKILKLDDLKNISVQKAILQEFTNECTPVLNYASDPINNNAIKNFTVGFKTRENFEKYLVLMEESLKLNTIDKMIVFIMKEDDKYYAELNAYIRKNLTRLKMPYSEFEKLSPNDKELLFKTFK